MLLAKRTLIVTGGGSGIGRAIAEVAAREGARVVVSDISEGGAEETLRLIAEATPGAETMFVEADASKPEDHERLVAAAVERFGGLHVAVNNAGIGGEMKPLHELSIGAGSSSSTSTESSTRCARRSPRCSRAGADRS